MAHVQRAGGVGGDELHQHLAIGTRAIAAVGITQLVDAPHDAGLCIARQEEIDEPGAGDLHLLDGGVLFQCGHDQLGDFARWLARRLGQAHREVAGEVAVGGIARTLHAKTVENDVGGQYVALEARQRGVQQLFDF